jgi:phage gpG-like protein
MTRVDWYGDDFLARLNAAAEVALDATAARLVANVQKTLEKTTGKVVNAGSRERNIYAASLPGTPPGWRSGRLHGSIESEKTGPLRRIVGTNLEYARIHELGQSLARKLAPLAITTS